MASSDAQVPPPSGYIGSLTPEESATLDKLRSWLVADYTGSALARPPISVVVEGVTITNGTVEDGGQLFRDSMVENFLAEVNDDRALLRFLRARRWVPEKAYESFIQAMAWRRSFGVLSLDDSNIDRTVIGYQLSHLVLGVRDPHNRPVLIIDIGRFGQANNGTIDMAALRRYAVYTIEVGVRIMNASAPRATAGAGPEALPQPILTGQALTGTYGSSGPVETATIIADMSGFNMKCFDLELIQFLVNLLQNNYPERMGALIIYNSGLLFKPVWPLVKNLFDQNVARKITFASKSEMVRMLGPGALPKALGGSQPNMLAPGPVEDEHLPRRFIPELVGAPSNWEAAAEADHIARVALSQRLGVDLVDAVPSQMGDAGRRTRKAAAAAAAAAAPATASHEAAAGSGPRTPAKSAPAVAGISSPATAPVVTRRAVARPRLSSAEAPPASDAAAGAAGSEALAAPDGLAAGDQVPPTSAAWLGLGDQSNGHFQLSPAGVVSFKRPVTKFPSTNPPQATLTLKNTHSAPLIFRFDCFSGLLAAASNANAPELSIRPSQGILAAGSTTVCTVEWLKHGSAVGRLVLRACPAPAAFNPANTPSKEVYAFWNQADARLLEFLSSGAATAGPGSMAPPALLQDPSPASSLILPGPDLPDLTIRRLVDAFQANDISSALITCHLLSTVVNTAAAVAEHGALGRPEQPATAGHAAAAGALLPPGAGRPASGPADRKYLLDGGVGGPAMAEAPGLAGAGLPPHAMSPHGPTGASVGMDLSVLEAVLQKHSGHLALSMGREVLMLAVVCVLSLLLGYFYGCHSTSLRLAATAASGGQCALASAAAAAAAAAPAAVIPS